MSRGKEEKQAFFSISLIFFTSHPFLYLEKMLIFLLNTGKSRGMTLYNGLAGAENLLFLKIHKYRGTLCIAQIHRYTNTQTIHIYTNS